MPLSKREKVPSIGGLSLTAFPFASQKAWERPSAHLIGNQDFIAKARRFRKVMGGGMRQAGYLAAAGIFALENHVERLQDDNRRARVLGDTLRQQNWVADVRPVQTNIVIFDLATPLTASDLLKKLEEKGVMATAFGPATVRFVTHLDFTEEMLGRVVEVINETRF